MQQFLAQTKAVYSEREISETVIHVSWWGFTARGRVLFQRTWLRIFVNFYLHTGKGARGGVVGWGTMLQAGRSRVRFSMWSLDSFNWPNPSSRNMTPGSTLPLTEMSTRNLPGSKGQPALKADNLTAICEPTVYKMWEPRRLTTIHSLLQG
jgi:hypothetical protein